MASFNGNCHDANDTSHNSQRNPSASSARQATLVSHLNVDAPEYVPGASSHHTTASYQNGPVWSTATNFEPLEPLDPLDPIEEMDQVICCLTYDPGSFDMIMEPLAYSLYHSVQTESTLLEIIDMLITQAMKDSNFRYTGARMCHYLSQHLDTKLGEGNFRQHLLKRCHTEHVKCEHMVRNGGQEEATVIGFTFFLGELLANLTDLENNRLLVLANALLNLLIDLIDLSTDRCLKCVCQVLKMTGAIMEEMANTEDDSLPKFAVIFDKIKSALASAKLSRDNNAMLLNILELRANDWGRTDEPPAGDCNDIVNIEAMCAPNEHLVPMAPHPDEYHPECPPEAAYDNVNGGGDWQAISDGFYLGFREDGQYVDPEDGQYDDDDGMDDEMDAAYEEFLRQTETHGT